MAFRKFVLVLVLALGATAATAGDLTHRPGWAVHVTTKTYEQLIKDVKTAAKSEKLGVVTQAGPTAAAANRGITIPGNRVIGLFNNDFAVRILALSTAAMIEAPIRLYVTESTDGTATLSYKTPNHVFAPYMAEGGAELADLADQLDARFAAVAQKAAN